MLEKAFIYNQVKQEWEISDDADITSKDISILPLVFTMLYEDKKWIWCPRHRNFEELTETNGIVFRSAEGCMITGVPVPSLHGPIESFDYSPEIPLRWRVFSRDFDKSLFVSADILLFRFGIAPASRFRCAPVLKHFAFSRRLFSFDEREKRSFSAVSNNRTLSLPDEVSAGILEIMKDEVERQYHVRPTTDTFLTGENKVTAFFFRPFEINGYILSPFFSDFDTVLPRDCMDGYHRLCKTLSIKTPKSMRKIYPKNPFALVMFRALRELGFTNYDLMRPFFDGTRIGEIDFKKICVNHLPFLPPLLDAEKNPMPILAGDDEDVLFQARIDEAIGGSVTHYEDWEQLAFLTKWLIERKGEKRIARRLLRYSMDQITRQNSDICRMIYKHFDEISEETKEMFVQNGFSHELHEQLVGETNRIEYTHEAIPYLPYERDFECEINGYCFELPETTRDIHQLAKALQNCVMSYTSDVCRKTSTIVSVRKENQFVGCIEVQKRSVMQALGFKNQLFQGELLHVVNYWMHRMMLHYATRDLYCKEFSRIPLQSFQWHNLPEKHTFFLYDLNELIDLPEEQIQSGYYRALGAKLFNNLSSFNHNDSIKKKYRHLLHDIPMNRMMDEKAGLHAACPSLDRIVDAAFQGNGEAQWVLSELYSEGFFIGIVKGNNLRGDYWKKKAEASGEPDFPKLYRFLHAGDLS